MSRKLKIDLWCLLALSALAIGVWSCAYPSGCAMEAAAQSISADSCSSNAEVCAFEPYDPSVYSSAQESLEAIVQARMQADNCCHGAYYGASITGWRAWSCQLSARLAFQEMLHGHCLYFGGDWCYDNAVLEEACCEPPAFSPRDYETEAEAWADAWATMAALHECCEDNYPLGWQRWSCMKARDGFMFTAEIAILAYFGN